MNERKRAAFRLGIELGIRKMSLEAAAGAEEEAFRAGELAMLFQDNLDFIIDYLKGKQVSHTIRIRSLLDK